MPNQKPTYNDLEQENQQLKKQLNAQQAASQNANRVKWKFAKWLASKFLGSRLTEVLKNIRDKVAEGTPPDSDDLIELSAEVFYRLTRVGIVGVILALIPSVMLVIQSVQLRNQNQLFKAQNERINQQTYLQEADRRSSLVFLFSNIMDAVDRELRENEGGNKPRNLSPQLIGRIISLSQRLKPYQYMNGDTLIGHLSSPERGQLLVNLIESQLDTSTYQEIWRKADFSYADLDNVKLNNLFLKGIFLNGASLKGAILENVNLEKANLSRVNLRAAILKKVNLREANLEETNLKGAYLQLVDLNTANLRRANLNDANLGQINTVDLKFEYISPEESLGVEKFTEEELKETRLKNAADSLVELAYSYSFEIMHYNVKNEEEEESQYEEIKEGEYNEREIKEEEYNEREQQIIAGVLRNETEVRRITNVIIYEYLSELNKVKPITDKAKILEEEVIKIKQKVDEKLKVITLSECKEKLRESDLMFLSNSEFVKRELIQAREYWIVDLRKANLEGANLKGVFLGRVNLKEADMRNVDMRWAYITGVNMRDVDMRGITFWGTDLSGTNLQGVDLRNTDLNAMSSREKGNSSNTPHKQNSGISDYNISDKKLFERLYFDASSLEGAKLDNSNFAGASLNYVNFVGASLKNVNFNHTDLERANFYKANMDNASLRYANLQNVRLRGGYLGDVTGANLNYACVNRTFLQRKSWGMRGVRRKYKERPPRGYELDFHGLNYTEYSSILEPIQK
jgi:uncharacterized protein YjbI with pentapeptide repeats